MFSHGYILPHCRGNVQSKMYKFYVKMLQVVGWILIMLGSWGETLPEAMRIGKRDAVPDADLEEPPVLSARSRSDGSGLPISTTARTDA